MKRILLFVLVCLLLSGCGKAQEGRGVEHCPICDARVDYAADNDQIAEWLMRQGYSVFPTEDSWEYVNKFITENREYFTDIMDAYAEEYLRDEGWTLIPPK